MAYVETPVFGSMRATKRSLVDELQDRGIPVLNPFAVEEHVAKMKAADRPTWGHEILHWLLQLVMTITLYRPLLWLGFGQITSRVISLGVIIGGTIIGFTFGHYLPFEAWWMFLPLLGFVILAVLIIMAELCDWDAPIMAANFWRFYKPSAFDDGAVPDRLTPRMNMAESIPNTRVRILADSSDPFLAVMRGYGPFQEIEYIGAWMTGTAMDKI